MSAVVASGVKLHCCLLGLGRAVAMKQLLRPLQTADNRLQGSHTANASPGSSKPNKDRHELQFAHRPVPQTHASRSSLPLDACSKQNEDRYALEVADGSLEAGVPEVGAARALCCSWALLHVPWALRLPRCGTARPVNP